MGNVWLAMNGSPEDELDVGYKAPVQQLLSIGETRSYNPSEWPDYCARFGLEREHVGDLIRMACDAALNQAESTSSKVWAPMHAWRALGQMRGPKRRCCRCWRFSERSRTTKRRTKNFRLCSA